MNKGRSSFEFITDGAARPGVRVTSHVRVTSQPPSPAVTCATDLPWKWPPCPPTRRRVAALAAGHFIPSHGQYRGSHRDGWCRGGQPECSRHWAWTCQWAAGGRPGLRAAWAAAAAITLSESWSSRLCQWLGLDDHRALSWSVPEPGNFKFDLKLTGSGTDHDARAGPGPSARASVAEPQAELPSRTRSAAAQPAGNLNGWHSNSSSPQVERIQV